MNQITITALNEEGKQALKNYCEKYKNQKPSFKAKMVHKALPYEEEVDDLTNPTFLTVTLSKIIPASHIVLLKIEKSIMNILVNYGGKPEDFKVDIQ